MQLTPPGSNASIIFGTQVTAAQPGSYATYASFHDTEGNRSLLQEITQRLPGRV